MNLLEEYSKILNSDLNSIVEFYTDLFEWIKLKGTEIEGMSELREYIISRLPSFIYLLSYNEETLKVYPYKFELYISYEIFENKEIAGVKKFFLKSMERNCGRAQLEIMLQNLELRRLWLMIWHYLLILRIF